VIAKDAEALFVGQQGRLHRKAPPEIQEPRPAGSIIGTRPKLDAIIRSTVTMLMPSLCPCDVAHLAVMCRHLSKLVGEVGIERIAHEETVGVVGAVLLA
jgi:hypothetical protein